MRPDPSGARRAALAAVVALALVHAAIATFSARANFVTVDEAGHIASGVSHHQHGTFASYRVNPPLARWLATLPVVLFQAPPRLEPLADVPGRRPEGAYGAALATALGPRYPSIVFVARLFNVGLSTLGLALVWALGRRAFGARAGLLAAAFYAFDPTILAHASVLTSDIAATVGALAFTWGLVRYLRRPRLGSALAVGALLGAAELTKASLLVLYPVWLVIATLAALRDRAALRARAAHAACALLVSVAVLDAGYGFAGVGARLDEYAFVSKSFSGRATRLGAQESDNRFRGTALGRIRLPIPRDYVMGVDLQRRDFEGALRSYVDGAWYGHGFWFYYAYAWLLKTPLATIGLFAVASLRLFARRVRAGRPVQTGRLALLLVPGVFFVFVSSQTGFSHHLRYVLPVLPFVALAIGSLAPALFRRRRPWVGLIAVAASVLPALAVVPHQLSYFNAIAGGWRHGDEHLVDSNVDWGQDLGRLGGWYRAHRDRPLRLAYFGGVDPHVVGLEYTLPPAEPEPGRFVLSVNFVRGMRFAAVDGAGRQITLPEGRYAYFGDWSPSERIGTSLRVYDVSLEQADEARRRLGLPRFVDPGTTAGRGAP